MLLENDTQTFKSSGTMSPVGANEKTKKLF